jgi:hypothetical protein
MKIIVPNIEFFNAAIPKNQENANEVCQNSLPYAQFKLVQNVRYKKVVKIEAVLEEAVRKSVL